MREQEKRENETRDEKQTTSTGDEEKRRILKKSNNLKNEKTCNVAKSRAKKQGVSESEHTTVVAVFGMKTQKETDRP